MSAPEPRQGGVSTREAAAILGTSVSDVLRRIRSGELRAERFERTGGTYFRVYLDPPQNAPGAPPEPRQHIEEPPTPEPRQDAPELVTGLLAIIEADRATIAEKDARLLEAAERIAGLSRELGEATTRAEMLEAERDELARRLAEAEERIRRRWWRFWG